VSDEMIDKQVKSYLSNFGHYDEEEDVQEKDMLKGDLLEMNEGKVLEDGRKVEDAVFTVDSMVDEEQKSLFLGAKKGDKVVFNPKKAFNDETELGYVLKIPKEEAKEIESDFQMEIKSITRFHEAEINQDLFDKIFGEGVVTSEEEFRNKIKENILLNLEEESNYKFLLDVRKYVIEKLKDLEFPDDFLKRWLKETKKEMTDEKIETEYPKMIEELKWQLAKDKIAEKEDIKIESNDVNEYAKKVARAQFAQYGMVGLSDDIVANYANELMKSEENVRNYVNRAVEEKVLDVIKNKITLENKKISMDEFEQLLKEDTNA
jgi:trigger factor